MEDYYYDDYDTEYYAPRKRYELLYVPEKSCQIGGECFRKPRNRVRTGNVLWPIAYESPKVKQFAAENTMEGVEPVYTVRFPFTSSVFTAFFQGADELQVVDNTGSEPDMVIVQSPTGPRTSGSKMIVQMPYVTEHTYQKPETGPLPPPNPAVVAQQQSYIPMPAPAPGDTYVAPQQILAAMNSDAYQVPQVAPNNYIAPPAESAYGNPHFSYLQYKLSSTTTDAAASSAWSECSIAAAAASVYAVLPAVVPASLSARIPTCCSAGVRSILSILPGISRVGRVKRHLW